jgi:phosphoribosylformylglycinamidine cyclo-ligase
VLPDNVDAEIFRDSWPIPPVFQWLQKLGDVEDAEMFRVFNMGIGLTLVVSDYYAESIQQQLTSQGFESWRIGRIVEGSGEGRWA